MEATFCFILFFIMAMVVIAWLIFEIGKRKKKNLQDENEYERRYLFIGHAIDEMEITPENYDYILRMLCQLGQMKFKNREKMEVITLRFFRWFKCEVDKRVSDI